MKPMKFLNPILEFTKPMKLFRFNLGIFGILLVVGMFLSFISMFFIGEGVISTNSLLFQILLMGLGICLIYFSFYYHESMDNGNSQLGLIFKWGVIYSIAILISNYAVNKLMISSSFLVLLFTAMLISVVTQVVISHEHRFRFKWFIFYFLIYVMLIWLIEIHILSRMLLQTSILSPFFVGFFISGVINIIKKLRINDRSIHWASFVLLGLIVLGNLDNFENLGDDFMQIGHNFSSLNGNTNRCPVPILNSGFPFLGSEYEISFTLTTMNQLIDTSIWKIESNMRNCYVGKFVGQNFDWVYCEDMVVSRFETTDSGVIKDRWYTAVIAIWKPTGETINDKKQYEFKSFECVNGEKVVKYPEQTSYYIHESRDGTTITLEY